MSTPDVTLVWFRDDLRLADNAALTQAANNGKVIGLFIHETVGRPLGQAAAWWQRRSLERLREALPAPLLEMRGDPREIIPQLAARHNAAVVWNRRYHLTQIDAAVKQATAADSQPGFLLTEPWEVTTKGGTPYKVFTPFSRAVRELLDDASPTTLPVPEITPAAVDPITPDTLAEPEWAATLAEHNCPGEQAAQARLEQFLAQLNTGEDYDNDALDGVTSGLSAHLRFGEISPATVWRAAVSAGAWEFARQLIWRDFAWHRFYHLPEMATRNVRSSFNHFDWAWSKRAVPGTTARAFAHEEMDPEAEHLTQLATWQAGRTGIPLVDAGMRELWESGRMHNRVRMVAGSWLTKNLGIHWRHGEEWFWDTLVDADAASNAFNWQWVAGSGDDAAPYFRVFNPLTQAEKFDPHGEYVRRWVPEVNTPLYPEPMVDIKASRAAALSAYEDIRNG